MSKPKDVGYAIKNDVVLSYGKPVKGIDAKSFVILSESYGKDKKHVYFQSHLVEGADPVTAKVLSELLLKDKNDTYYCNTALNADDLDIVALNENYCASESAVYYCGQRIEGVIARDFQVLAPNYAKDSQSIFYTRTLLTNVDYESFEALTSNYARDCNHIYCGNRVLNNADYDNFSVIKHPYHGSYATDDKHVYHDDNQLLFADPKSFFVKSDIYSLDKNNVYRHGRKIKHAKPSSFDVIEESVNTDYYINVIQLSKDENNIYHEDEILCVNDGSFQLIKYPYYQLKQRIYHLSCLDPLPDLLDINTFHPIDTQWSKDSKHVYRYNEIQPQIDAGTFRVIGESYAVDHCKVFYRGDLLEGINAINFTLLGDGWARSSERLIFEGHVFLNSDADTVEWIDEIYTRDKNHVYYYHRHHHIVEVIDSADSKTFQTFDRAFCKDAFQAYYFGEAIEGVDSESFDVIDYAFSRDKNRIYYGGDVLTDQPGENFTLLDYNKAIDDQYFYHDDNKTPIHRATFELINDSYASDHQFVYFKGQVLEKADPISFTTHEHYYCLDKNHVYYGSTILVLNVSVVQVIDNAYIKDRESVYFLDKKLTNADPDSFFHLGGNFSKDKKQVYFYETIIRDADADSFERLGGNECRDKKYRYYLKHGEVKREVLKPP